MTRFWLKYPWTYNLIQIIATGGFLRKIVSSVPDLNQKRVFDLGCGTGNLLNFFKPRSYLGWDVNGNYINYASNKYKNSDYKFYKRDIVIANLPNRHFDYTIVVNVLHHLEDEDVNLLFRKLRKWNKTNSLLIIESNPRGTIGKILEKFDAGSNFREFSELKKILQKNAKVKSMRIVAAPLNTYEYLVIECKLR